MGVVLLSAFQSQWLFKAHMRLLKYHRKVVAGNTTLAVDILPIEHIHDHMDTQAQWCGDAQGRLQQILVGIRMVKQYLIDVAALPRYAVILTRQVHSVALFIRWGYTPVDSRGAHFLTSHEASTQRNLAEYLSWIHSPIIADVGEGLCLRYT